MAECRITYDTIASLTYIVDAANENEARQTWQNGAQFDFDEHDFAGGGADKESIQLARLEMLGEARNFEVGSSRSHDAAV
jgi:hypothetical protein